MNCCDANGRCRCPNGDRNLRFAPGVIEHTPRHPLGTSQQRRELRRWARYLVAAVVLCLASIGAGLLIGMVWAAARSV